jgi:hypothetical protein
MCGLAGVAGNTSIKVRDAFNDLLLITQLRGQDATGVFTVGHRGVSHVKDTGPPTNLFDRKSYDAVMNGVPKIMAGHCRAKTIGENNRENAHPYEFDNVVGMHNGTLRSYYQMEGHDYKRTDSHCLYYNIDRYGVEETIPKLDPDGAWALVWWDKDAQRLNFIRNDKRPLWFAWTKNKDAMFWCSEPWMFSAVSRHVELWDGTEEGKEPKSPYFQIPSDQLWSFTVNSHVKPGEKYLVFHQPRELKAEGKKPVGFLPGYSGANGTGNRGGEVANPFTEAQRKAIEEPEDAITDEVYKRYLARNRGKIEELDDKVDDISPAGSTSTPSSVTKSGKSSSNVLDFRAAKNLSKSSARKTLSLTSSLSSVSQQSVNENGTDGSRKSCSTGLNHPSPSFPGISIRDVLGTEYITHNGYGEEISIHEFQARTNGQCSFCNKPIGDLKEVASFTNRAMTGFVCTSCVSEPEICMVG